ncbi:rhomboid family intramembrane serine protease [Albirhodobacter sp. R86504]|uniref:rhomboid family intramembrane serine protease n=1 Tax=Albirhodobacter sp. R86504 TaxID=3093848 RepID=UPI00366D4A4A
MREGFDVSPVNPLPPVVWLLLLPIVAIEVVAALAGVGLVGGGNGIAFRQEMLAKFAYAPDMGRAMMEVGQWPFDYIMRGATYPFVHASFTHAMMVGVFILALGKMVGEVFAGWAVAAVFVASAIVGAIVYTLVPASNMPLIGGYPAVYGLVGAFTWLLWTRLGMAHANRMRAFSLIGMLLGIQLIFGVIFGGGWDWIAELAGFATGFGLSFFVAPGGFARALERLRQRS